MKWHLHGSISMAYGDATYQYNNHGTLTEKTQGGITTEYTYDTRGSLMQVSEGTNTVRYTLDPFGRRIAREKDGETTHRWLYQNFLQPIEEIKAGVRTRFVYATGVNVPDYMIRENETYRFIRDIRGSVRLVVNAVGNVAQRIDYDEWGNILLDTNPGFQPFGFAGGLYDPDTSLVRFGYRDYDPSTGRWTAKDPILFNGGQVNLYLYCHGDPVNFVDSDGLWRVTLGVGFGYAARLSFGKNNGRWSVGFDVGYGIGAMASFTPETEKDKATGGLTAAFGVEISGGAKISGLDVGFGVRGITTSDALNNLETRVGIMGAATLPGTIINIGRGGDIVALGNLTDNTFEIYFEESPTPVELGVGGMIFGGVTMGISWGGK